MDFVNTKCKPVSIKYWNGQSNFLSTSFWRPRQHHRRSPVRSYRQRWHRSRPCLFFSERNSILARVDFKHLHIYNICMSVWMNYFIEFCRVLKYVGAILCRSRLFWNFNWINALVVKITERCRCHLLRKRTENHCEIQISSA